MPLQPAEHRRLRHREEARRAILDAAESLLVEQGYESFSMRRLAARCGYTAPTIYHYFPDKPRLLDILLEERFEELFEQLKAVPPSGDALVDLRELVVAFVRFGLRHPTHYYLLTMPRDPKEPRPPSAEKVLGLLYQPIQKLESLGRLAPDDRVSATQAVWVLMHGVISLLSSRPDYGWVENLPKVAVDLLLRGLTLPRAEVRA